MYGRGNHNISWLIKAALASFPIVSLGSIVVAQVISNPNQIRGTIELTNVDPAVLAILDDKGFSSGSLGAESIGTTPTLDNSTDVTVTGATTATYELTVQSSAAGIAYRLFHRHPALGVERSLRLDGGGDVYLLAEQISEPVFPEPEPDVELDFAECVGIVDVQFVDQAGLPTTVDGGSITSRVQPSDVIQAQDFELPAGTSSETLAVRGEGSDVRIDVSFFRTVGSDAFQDLIRFEGTCQEDLVVQCDQIQVVQCEVPFDAAGDADAEDLGEIRGEVDLVGEDEHFILVVADLGPFDNRRLAAVSPGSGALLLPNLLRSDFVSPPRGYRVSGLSSFRLGHAYQYFQTPYLGLYRGTSSNPSVVVEGEMVTDLGNVLVMDPGFLDVDILFAGPPLEAHGSCLEDVTRSADFDADGDGIPDDVGLSSFSRLEAVGLDRLADGASFSAWGGIIRGGFGGSFNPATLSFEGSSELLLPGLAGEPSIWRGTSLRLRFLDADVPGVPEGYQDSTVLIDNPTIADFEVLPGQHIPVDHRYCFGEVRVRFGSSSGSFFNPRLSGRLGSFAGADFEGNPASYNVRVDAGGTPVSEASAGSEGLVVFCAPEATYTLTPAVTSVDPGGGTTDTELPPITFSCGCRQVCELTPELQISLDPVAECTADGALPVSGSVNSDVGVDRIFYTAGDGPEVDVCPGDCGIDPDFAATAALSACDNELTVTVVDVLGNEASVTSTVTFDPQPPVFSGCEPIAVEIEPGDTGALVSFDVTAVDACSGPVSVECDPPSGSFFPEGETQVTCTAVDACGGAGQCIFPVTVSGCHPVAPNARRRGFWKRQCLGPHPSGEHGNLPSYVDYLSAYQTFSNVDSADALCSFLTPRPRQDKCERAEAQLMAAALNVASGRLAECNCIDDPGHSAATLGEVLADLDALLADSARSIGDCRRAKAIAGRINRGENNCDSGGDDCDSDSDSGDSDSDSGSDSDSDSGSDSDSD